MQRDDFKKQITLVAASLGEEWSIEFDYWDVRNDNGDIEKQLVVTRFYLLYKGARRLYAHSKYGKENHFEFSGVYPKDKNNYSFDHPDDPKCGINITRTAKSIASDITSRILRKVNSLHVERVRKCAERDASYSRLEDRTSQIILALNGTVIDTHNSPYQNHVHSKGGTSTEIHVGSNDCTIKIGRLDLETSLMIAYIISAKEKQLQCQNQKPQ